MRVLACTLLLTVTAAAHPADYLTLTTNAVQDGREVRLEVMLDSLRIAEHAKRPSLVARIEDNQSLDAETTALADACVASSLDLSLGGRSWPVPALKWTRVPVTDTGADGKPATHIYLVGNASTAWPSASGRATLRASGSLMVGWLRQIEGTTLGQLQVLMPGETSAVWVFAAPRSEMPWAWIIGGGISVLFFAFWLLRRRN